jgi:hypothetical protein
MLEAGVQVVYLYISDVHDNRSGSGTFGPGEAGYVAQLKQYDTAFGKFFARLGADRPTETSRHSVNPRHGLQSEWLQKIIKLTKHFVGTHPAGTRAKSSRRIEIESHRVSSESSDARL